MGQVYGVIILNAHPVSRLRPRHRLNRRTGRVCRRTTLVLVVHRAAGVGRFTASPVDRNDFLGVDGGLDDRVRCGDEPTGRKRQRFFLGNVREKSQSDASDTSDQQVGEAYDRRFTPPGFSFTSFT